METSFVCIRKHTFFSKQYHLRVLNDIVEISPRPDFSNPKYILKINLKNQMLWKVNGVQIKAFGIFYVDRIKYFEASHQNLLRLKESLSGRVIYRNMASFYEPLELIGEGLSAQVVRVFKSKDILTGDVYAIKMIKRDYAEDLLDIVQNEVTLLKSLQNKNIIKVREVFENDNTFWIVQEYVGGIPLVNMIRNEKLPLVRAKEIILNLLETIEYIQGRSIVHKDIKPDNIIITKNGLKLIDFGFAVNLKNKTQRQICGTPGYFAPELLKYKEVSINSDVFSAGVVLLNMLTQQQNIKNDKALQLEEFAADIIRCMMEPDPSKRINAKDALRHPFFDDFSFPLLSIEEGQRHDCCHTESKSIKSLKTQKTKP
ncbi:hypothetical protein pb186bvf_013554 [Paramecium bursaria]